MKSLITRSISGIVFLAIMVGGILFSPVTYACLMSIILIVMMWEFYRMTLGEKHFLQKIIGVVAGVAFWAAFLVLNEDAFACFFALLLLIFLLWITLFIQQLYQKSEQPFRTIAYTFLGFFYIALPWSLLNFIVYDNFIFGFRGNGYNGNLLLAMFILLWCSDVGAYVFGMLFGQHGKHKLFPSISPKKSWEGFIGGVLTTLAAAYIINLFDFISLGLIDTLAIALLIAVFGVFGDLVESMLKRSVGVKDSGKIMPGHGGLLDRFDAALLAFPVVWIYLLMLDFSRTL